MENHLENNMENEMEVGAYIGIIANTQEYNLDGTKNPNVK